MHLLGNHITVFILKVVVEPVRPGPANARDVTFFACTVTDYPISYRIASELNITLARYRELIDGCAAY